MDVFNIIQPPPPSGLIHMIQEMKRLLDQNSAWLKDRPNLREVGEFVVITTPYLDRHNNYLQIYSKRSNGGFVLTDDDYVLDNLRLSGYKIASQNRQAKFQKTLNGLSVQPQGRVLEVKATPENFSLGKCNLGQPMLGVNGLFCLASPTDASLFHKDVTVWLDSTNMRYTPHVKFTGKRGNDDGFSFVKPKSRVQPERELHAINRPNRDTAQAMAFSWIGTKEVRSSKARAYVILNDSNQTVSESILGAMRNYEGQPVPWSNRDEAVNELVA